MRAIDLEVRQMLEAGEVDAAITAVIDHHGDDLFGFLTGLAGDRDRAGDLFSATCERAWRALAAFRWESSLRTWLYRIARNEFLRDAGRKRRSVPLSAVPGIEAAVQRVRTSTPIHQRTPIKERFAVLREKLSPEDHMLLGLRLERAMSWEEIAGVLGSGDPARREREVAALRKRFERLKARLKAMAAQLRDD